MALGPKNATVISVMGTGRSGASVITKILNSLGVYLGPDEFLMPPASHSPKGNFELQPICALNNEILGLLGGSCWEPPNFPKGWEKSPILGEQRIKLQALIRTIFGSSSLWAWKDLRSCWTLPFWRQFLPEIRYIFALRNPLDVAASLKESDGLEFETALTYWHRAMSAALQHTSGQERLFVFYDDIMENWELELERIARFVGKSDVATFPNVRGLVCTFIDEKLQHNKTSLATVISDPRLPFSIKALYMTLRASVNGAGDPRVMLGVSPNPFEKILDMFGHQSVQAQIELDHLAERCIRADRKNEQGSTPPGERPAERVGALAARLATAPAQDVVSRKLDVSIIIPVHGRKDFTKQCLESLYRNTSAENHFEVILVDNASLDETSALLHRARRHYPRVRVFTQSENLGFAKACNLGARNATGEYLMFLNNDTEVQRGWLDPLVQVLKADAKVAAAGSKLLYPDKRIQHAGIAVISDPKTGDPLVPRAMFNGLANEFEEANEARTYQALSAACLMVRKSAFDAVGGFDEAFWNGQEDVDLGFRIQEKGWLMVYRPDSVVIHHEAQSGPERSRCILENADLLHRKWLSKVEPDFILDPDGMLSDTGSGRIRRYELEESMPDPVPA